MKPIRFSLLACLALFATLISPAYGNHRTGAAALPELLAAADFNQDTNLDLAVNVTGFDNVALFLGDGQGGFTLTGHLNSDTLTKGLDIADVDGDGRLDLVGCTSWGYDVLVHLGDGAGGFGHRDQSYSGDGEPTRVILADFNNDRRPDIAVNAPEEDKILVYLNDRKGGFITPAIELEGIPHPNGISTGDFNGDGNLDMVTACIPNPARGDGSAVVLLGDGTGQFTISTQPAVGGLPTSVKVGDLDNDGKLDFVIAGAQPTNTTGNYVSTFLGDGTGHFTAKQTIDLGAGNLKGEIAVADFNEDGKLDVAYPQTGIQVHREHGTKLFVFFGDGTGNLVSGPILTVGEEPHSVIAVDVNKDGHLDLINSNRTSGTISVLLGDGQGNFAAPRSFSVLE